MTPEQIHELAKQIAANGLPPSWGQWGLLLVLQFLGLFLSAFIGAYWAKRGEIKAIKTDLETVIDQQAALHYRHRHDKLQYQ